MEQDIIFITADSVRYDSLDAMPHLNTGPVCKAVTAAHYTRASLASMLSSSYLAALQSRIVSPSLPAVLQEHGYTTIGLTTSPQADPAFDFDTGFDTYYHPVDAGSRGSRIREFFASFTPLRRLYQRFFHRTKRRADVPRLSTVVDEAITRFNAAEPPRFLWIHVMDTHRPYGRGEDGIPPSLDRKAMFDPEKLTETEQETIRDAYHSALTAADEEINRLRTELDTENPVFAFSADHGEAFGEHGYYFHPPWKHCVDDEVVTVPLVFDGVDVDVDRASTLDIAATLLAAADIDIPEQWHGTNLLQEAPTSVLTVATYNEKTRVAWRNFRDTFILDDVTPDFYRGDAQVDTAAADVPDAVKERLEDLGYIK